MRKKLFSFMLMAVGLLISGNSWAAGDATAETGVARIGEQYYSTFAKAIADVPTTRVETVVELLKDCDAKEVSIATGKNVTLNCNLCTIRNARTDINKSSDANTTPVLKVYGTLTLNGTAYADSSIVGGIDGLNFCVMTVESADAKITINSGRYQSHDKMAIIEINQSAELVINGGDFIGGSNAMYGMIINSNTFNAPKITINNGNFSLNVTNNAGSTNRASIIYSSGTDASVNINGGLFTMQYSGGSSSRTYSCVDIRGKSNVTITGGTFINNTTAEIISSKNLSKQSIAALFVYEGASASISGGYFYCPNAMAAQIWSNDGNVTTVNVEDATFEGSYGGLMITCYNTQNQVNINGGYYKGGNFGLLIAIKSNVNFLWGKVEGSSVGMNVQGNANVSIMGGTIQGGTGYGIQNTTKGSLTIGGTANIKNGLYVRDGETTINGGQITTTGEKAVYVTTKDDSSPTIKISGTPIITSTHSNGYAFYNDGGTATIDGGRFYGGAGSTKTADSNPAGPVTTISDGIYNLDPIDGTGCELVSDDYEVITNPDLSTKDVYPYAIGKKTFPVIEVNDDANRTIDWKTITTWAGGNIIPDKGDDVTIADEKNVEVGKSGKTDAYAHKITVDNGSDLIIDGGSKLTVGNGGIVLGSTGDGGEVIIKANAEDGTGVLLFSPVAEESKTTVEATIELRTTARHEDDEYIWNYIGIPLKLNAGEFTADSWSKTPVNPTDQNFGTYWQKWDIVEGWQNVGLEAVEPFKGFAITNESSQGVVYTFKGTLVGNQDKQMNFTHKGFNFFANSYTAPIDIEELLNGLSNDVKATIYMFDSENNQFKSVSKSAFEGYIPPAFRVIPIMNGFFILMDEKNSATESVDYGEAVYNAALGNRPIYAPARQEELDFSRVRININSTTGKQDAMYLVENSEFTADFENGYDEVKYMNDNLNVYANTTYGDQSAVFSDDLEGTIISMNATNDQVFTLSFDEQVGDLYTLTDIVTGKQVTMDANSTYIFTADAQNMGQRFMVTKAQNISTDMQNVKASAKKMGVYSVTGQYFGKTANFNALPKGVYIINGTKVVK